MHDSPSYAGLRARFAVGGGFPAPADDFRACSFDVHLISDLIITPRADRFEATPYRQITGIERTSMENTAENKQEFAGFTRRRLLGSAATVGALAGRGPWRCPPTCARRSPADSVKGGQLKDIEHVVLLMQENRSFDHYYGTLSGVRGFSDPHAMRLPNGRLGLQAAGPDQPARATCCPTTSTPRPPRPRPSRPPAMSGPCSTQAWNNGKMDNWLPAHRAADGANGPYMMGYLHPRGHPVPVRAGRRLHHLRLLPLLGARPDRPEPAHVDDRHHRPQRHRRRARRSTTSAPNAAVLLQDLPGAADRGTA